MLSIKTNEFELNRKEYFWTLMAISWSRTWWLYSGIFILLTVYIFIYLPFQFEVAPPESYYLMSLKIMAGYFIFSVIVFTLSKLIMAMDKKNAGFFKRKYIEFDDNTILVYEGENDFSKIGYNSVVRVKKMSGNYLLYLSRITALFIPESAFNSEQDIMSFQQLLKSKKLLKDN